jgi:hypothetical protein
MRTVKEVRDALGGYPDDAELIVIPSWGGACRLTGIAKFYEPPALQDKVAIVCHPWLVMRDD